MVAAPRDGSGAGRGLVMAGETFSLCHGWACGGMMLRRGCARG